MPISPRNHARELAGDIKNFEGDLKADISRQFIPSDDSANATSASRHNLPHRKTVTFLNADSNGN